MDWTISPKNSDYHNTPWHHLNSMEVLDKMNVTEIGLSDLEVATRRAEFGFNAMPSEPAAGLVTVLVRQFLSPLIYILLIAAVVSLALGKFTDTVFVMIVIFLNAIIGTWQELKAEKNAQSLQQLMKIRIVALRNGDEVDLDAEHLVPGDIVKLESGNKVPADIRLLSGHNLSVDESLLTGESMSSAKQFRKQVPLEAPIISQNNMLFAGTTVLTGRALGVVVRVGSHSEVGKIAKALASSKHEKAPLIVRMERFTKNISIVFLVACLLLLVVAVSKGMPLSDFFFLAVALAVSVIPEGLPVALTIALSVAAYRMSKYHVIIRQLSAVEALGSCTLIASDKTGTLTINQQTAKSIWLPSDHSYQVSGLGYNGKGQLKGFSNAPDSSTNHDLRELIRAGALNNEAGLVYKKGSWHYHGDSIDVAFLALALKAGLDIDKLKLAHHQFEAIPYESDHRYAAIRVAMANSSTIYVKGATKETLKMCTQMLVNGKSVSLDKDLINKQIKALTSDGFRVLALAKKGGLSDSSKLMLSHRVLREMTFLGLVAFVDPLRRESRQVIEQCHGAGIQVAMITGDHPATALYIAKQLGIADDSHQVITGDQLDKLGEPDSPEFYEQIAPCRVFAQVSPVQKLKIVDAFMKLGHFVAVTGDGVNDAPALKRANIGVAMGTGTDVAKESASMIVVDDDFSSIVKGVEAGRFAYDNVRKVIYLLISTGFAEIVLFVLAIFGGLPLPLIAVQLLWLNLVTNGIQHIALAFEAGESGAMSRQPRSPKEGIFNPIMIQQTVLSGLVMGVVAVVTWLVMIKYLGYEETTARNLLFLLMILFENMHVFNCRSESQSVFKISLFKNKMLIWGVLGAQLVHLLAMHQPQLAKILYISPVSFAEWLILLLVSASIIVSSEIFKLSKRSTN